MKKDYINYPKLIDEAMHTAVRSVLRIVEHDGINEDHQFFISFLTGFPEVQLSKRMTAKYPKEITIVLQHQFEKLTVEDTFFSIGLTFNGIFETVIVPYKAITSFTDAGAKFAIQFGYYAENPEDIPHAEPDTPEIESVTGNIIMLDKFRKKKK